MKKNGCLFSFLSNIAYFSRAMVMQTSAFLLKSAVVIFSASLK